MSLPVFDSISAISEYIVPFLLFIIAGILLIRN